MIPGPLSFARANSAFARANQCRRGADGQLFGRRPWFAFERLRPLRSRAFLPMSPSIGAPAHPRRRQGAHAPTRAVRDAPRPVGSALPGGSIVVECSARDDINVAEVTVEIQEMVVVNAA